MIQDTPRPDMYLPGSYSTAASYENLNMLRGALVRLLQDWPGHITVLLLLYLRPVITLAGLMAGHNLALTLGSSGATTRRER